MPRDRWKKFDLAIPNREACLPSIVKYNKPIFEVDEQTWLMAEQWCIKHFNAASNSLELFADENVFRLMELSSSAGYPYSLLSGMKTKRKLLEREDIKQQIYDYNDRIEQEETPVFWAVHEKEEIRANKKLVVNRIRTFVGSSIEFLYACMTMFYEMNDKMYSSAAEHRNWSFVGATKFRLGWDSLFKRLSKHPNAFALDETDYDCSLLERFLSSCERIRCAFLRDATPEQIRKIHNLYIEIIHSFMVLPFGDVIRKFMGNPSGSYNTITDNVLVLYMLLAYAWLLLTPKKFHSYEMFHKHVEAALCGDDNTWTVSNECLEYFNAKTVCALWTNLGISTKTDDYEPRKLIQCEFMSSHFREIFHVETGIKYYVPFPETDKVMASMSFDLKFNNARWSLLRANALRLESFFNDECRLILAEYIVWVQKQFWDELNSPLDPTKEFDFLTYSQVMTVYKTDMEIAELYFGEREGNDFSPEVQKALNMLEL